MYGSKTPSKMPSRNSFKAVRNICVTGLISQSYPRFRILPVRRYCFRNAKTVLGNGKRLSGFTFQVDRRLLVHSNGKVAAKVINTSEKGMNSFAIRE